VKNNSSFLRDKGKGARSAGEEREERKKARSKKKKKKQKKFEKTKIRWKEMTV
jgi:hypothetical protein